ADAGPLLHRADCSLSRFSHAVGDPMSGSPQVVTILVVVFALIAVMFLTREASIDFASPLRNWLWARDARRYAAHSEYPATLRRAYWHEREYQSDRHRLEALGHVIFSADTIDPYVTPARWVPSGQSPRTPVPLAFLI